MFFVNSFFRFIIKRVRFPGQDLFSLSSPSYPPMTLDDCKDSIYTQATSSNNIIQNDDRRLVWGISAVTGIAALAVPVWPFPWPAEWWRRFYRTRAMDNYAQGHLSDALKAGAHTATHGNLVNLDPTARAVAVGSIAGWEVGFAVARDITRST